jgi:hypothetical protein
VTQAQDSNTVSHTARAEPGSPEYKAKVAEPTMNAVDAMPSDFRELVHQFGYVDVYRAWRRGWTPERIRACAINGFFRLP